MGSNIIKDEGVLEKLLDMIGRFNLGGAKC